MKTILVPTDFSKNAENALYYAIAIAERNKSKILLLHTYLIDYPVSYTSYELIVEEKKKALDYSEHRLNAEAMKIRHAGNIAFEILSEEDSALDGILKLTKQRQVDLVIMGTKGESNLSNAILGSTTAGVIQKINCPVLAVPMGVSFEAIKKITYAVAYNPDDFDVLEKVVGLAKLFNAQVNVLHIIETTEAGPQTKENEKMKAFMDEANRRIDYNNMSYQLLEGETIEDSLERYVSENSTNILVMSTHHRGFFKRLFGRSVTKYMAYHSEAPLMAFHLNT
jgi:nucleotide-binding universal stress UspA family protein